MKKADLEAIVRTLNGAGVPFIVVGGIAVIEHGYGRSTYDVGLVVRLTPEFILKAFPALAGIGYLPRVPITAEEFADPEHRRRMITEKRMQVLNFWNDARRETPLDIFVTEPFDFAQEHAKAEAREIAPAWQRGLWRCRRSSR